MARYVVHVSTSMSPEEAFAYMADLRNFAEWDPGVSKVEQVEGEGAGPDASFDLTVNAYGTSSKLRYVTKTFDAPERAVVVAENTLLVSDDTIVVRPDGDGSIVTYDAELKLKGVLGLGDPLLGIAFKQIGDKAAAGLIDALDGTKVSDTAVAASP